MKAAGLVTTSPPLAPDTYIYRIISGYERLLSISSDDSLRLIDRHTLQHAPPYTFSQIHHGITCLGALEDRGILTAGRDGVVKCTDPRTSKSALDISKGTSFLSRSMEAQEKV